MKTTWTTKQHRFYQEWQKFRQEHSHVYSREQAEWPAENEAILLVVKQARMRYYTQLQSVYFSEPSIIVEIGAEERFSWTDTIDKEKHVLLRSSWSRKKEKKEPDSIWQIPIQELLDLLDSPRYTEMTKQISHIVMENTLDCLPRYVLQRLLSFAKKYQIRIISLQYRPLSAPSMQDISEHSIDVHRDCPALVMVAQALLRQYAPLSESKTLALLFVYRPPMGSPVVHTYTLRNTPEDKQRYQAIQREVSQGKGAVQVLVLPSAEKIAQDTSVLQQTLYQLIGLILQISDRPSSGYRVHMTKDLDAQNSVSEIWNHALGVLVHNEGSKIQVFIDATSVPADNASSWIHTKDGELLHALQFIEQWKKNGWQENVLRRYIVGYIGTTEGMSCPVHRQEIDDFHGCIFQATRIDIMP